MADLGNTASIPSGMVSSEPPPTEPCILCTKPITGIRALRGRRKYCTPCKMDIPPNHHVCVHPFHQGPRVLLDGWFYTIFKGNQAKVSSYCKMCQGIPTKKG